MNVVWVVQECWYSSQDVYGVFSEEAKAIKYKELLEKKYPSIKFDYFPMVVDEEAYE